MIFLSLRVTADAEGDLKGPARPCRSLRGLGGVSHQQASAGIYRRIACYYYRNISSGAWNQVSSGIQRSSTVPVSPWRFFATIHSTLLRFFKSSL